MFFNFLIFYFAFCRNFVSLKNAAPVQSNSLQASWHSLKCLEHIDEATTRPPSMLLQRLWRLWPQPHCLRRAIANKVASCCHSVLPHEDVVLDSRTCWGISSATACALRPWRSHTPWIHSLQLGGNSFRA
ncbi:unnamed protein product [Sphagnum jensenii]|uniref:Secreted protein n=1 Tax=Sphagnum jensenii TaxID=128206 RepID=A0ABP1BSC5_9BRYO